MRTLLLNHSDRSGGAARAAYRIHCALRWAGVDSHMYVDMASFDDITVSGPNGKLSKRMTHFRPEFDRLLNRLLISKSSTLRSPNLLPSGWLKRINNIPSDLVHLHWINDAMLSIGDIGRINKPIVWTLHDMWAFCGAEHYTEDFRWRDGYTRNNRPSLDRGIDLNRWVWQRKRKTWSRPIHIVTPSAWLAGCVKKSALMRDWPVSVVPNPIDTGIWFPVEKRMARQLLQLPLDVPLLLFGAMGGTNDPRKGFDLLYQALQNLLGQIHGLQLVVFGQGPPRDIPDFGFPVHYLGHLHDDLTLRVVYCAADALVIPSRLEVFGQTASEANACGTPAIGFNNSGVSAIISHLQNGYLARAFEAEDLAQGIQWVLSDSQRYKDLCDNARQNAIEKFSYPVIAKQYLQIYKNAIGSF